MSRIPFCVVVLVAALSLFGYREVQPALDLQPSRVYPVPDTTKEEYLKMYDVLDQGLAELPEDVATSPIYRHFYSPSCSWYCSGVVEKVWASSNLKNDRYGHCYAENIHKLRNIITFNLVYHIKRSSCRWAYSPFSCKFIVKIFCAHTNHTAMSKFFGKMFFHITKQRQRKTVP